MRRGGFARTAVSCVLCPPAQRPPRALQAPCVIPDSAPDGDMASPAGPACAATSATTAPTWASRRARAYALLVAAAKIRAPARTGNASQAHTAAWVMCLVCSLQHARKHSIERCLGRVKSRRHCRPKTLRISATRDHAHAEHSASFPPRKSSVSALCARIVRQNCNMESCVRWTGRRPGCLPDAAVTGLSFGPMRRN